MAEDSKEFCDPLGDKPHNPIGLKAIEPIEGVPAEGLLASLSRTALVQELVDKLVEKLMVATDEVSLVYEGRTVDVQKTISDNGIVEPGPAARRRGDRIELKFMLKDGVVPGYVKIAAAEAAQAVETKAREEAEKKRQEAEKKKQVEWQKKCQDAEYEWLNDAKYCLGFQNLDKFKDESLQPLYVEVQEALLKPHKSIDIGTTETHGEANIDEIRNVLMKVFPSCETLVSEHPENEGKLALDIIFEKCKNGFPSYPAMVSLHLQTTLKQSLAELVKQHAEDSTGTLMNRHQKASQKLVKAFMECEGVLGRSIENFAADLSGRNCLESQLKDMILDAQRRYFSNVVAKLHPEAVLNGDINVLNRYKKHQGLLGIDDVCPDGLRPLTESEALKLHVYFKVFLNISEIVNDFVADVNLPSSTLKERAIDPEFVNKYAAEHPEVQHRIFYDEDEAERYKGTMPAEEDQYKPFLYFGLALEIMHDVLVKGEYALR